MDALSHIGAVMIAAGATFVLSGLAICLSILVTNMVLRW